MSVAWVLLTSIRVIKLTVLQFQGIIQFAIKRALRTHIVTTPVPIAYWHRLWTSESELNRKVRYTYRGQFNSHKWNVVTFRFLFLISAGNSTEQKRWRYRSGRPCPMIQWRGSSGRVMSCGIFNMKQEKVNYPDGVRSNIRMIAKRHSCQTWLNGKRGGAYTSRVYADSCKFYQTSPHMIIIW
jgi:hypothetical protein